VVRRVPRRAGEKESLLAALERHRDVVLWKLEGLDDEQLRRPMTPTGTSLLGLVKHLAATEYGWFCETFGRPVEPLWFDPADDFRITAGESTDDIIAFFGRARLAANKVVEEVDIEATGPAGPGEPVTLRWVLIHMLEEAARHAGHMDILRELIDGAAGDHPWDD
jgi:uncharacterized damage-inducible protein DinB